MTSFARTSLALFTAAASGFASFAGCGVDESGQATPAEQTSDAADDSGWSKESHTKDGPPNYEQVFPENAVRRIDVTILPADWKVMQDDLASMFGPSGTGGFGGPGGGRFPEGGFPEGGFPEGGFPEGGPPPGFPEGGAPGGRPGGGFLQRDPIYVPCTVHFDGRRWDHVAVRYKGNSSIASAWSSGNGKLPLRFNFTKLKSQYPEVDDQRFWGFKDLSLSNVMGDDSMIREKLTNDFFRVAGVPVGRSAFYRVYVDRGEGSTYFGLYTATEVPEDQFLVGTFGSDDGNLYKPESTLASFSAEQFEKKTNENAADFSDVQRFIAALNADRTDTAAWRAGLDATFDTPAFMRWLATNTLVVNWDVYGAMAHNYYLYANPASANKLTWIAWDSSLAFQSNGMGGMGARAASLDQSSVGASWPLIRYTMDDAAYQAAYYAALREVAGLFTYQNLTPKIQAAHDLVAPYVVGPEGEIDGYTFLTSAAAFNESVTALGAHVKEREAAAAAALTGR